MHSIGYIIRILTCFFLIFATWNPTGVSYVDWAFESDARLSLRIAVGILLATTHIAFLRMTWVALGTPGTVLVWIFVLSGYLSLRQFGIFADAPLWTPWLSLVCAATVFSAGICWAHFKRRYTGQSPVLAPPP